MVATIGVHPSTRMAHRFLERHVPADVLAQARASTPAADKGAAPGPPSLIDVEPPVARGPG